MQQGSDVTSPKDDLLSNSGRNLLLFQRIEVVLKELISLGSITTSSITGNRANAPSNQSLGLVAAAFIERHLSAGPPAVTEIAQRREEIILQSSYHIGGEAASELATRLRKAVLDRNRLAHRLILDFDLSTNAGRDAARLWLEESHGEQSGLLEILIEHHRMLRASLRAIIAFLQSDEGKSELFLPDIQRTSIIEWMFGVAKAQASPDDWITIAEAAKGESRSIVQETLQRFEKKSLTGLMLASQLFEVRAEESPDGGTRMLYRLAPIAPCDPVG